LYLDPEQLHVSKPAFRQQLPVLTWRYDLTPYGLERFKANARYRAEDWRAGALHAAMVLGAIVGLSLIIAAFATGHQLLLWDNLHWVAGIWLASVTAVYLHAWLGYRVENPYPLRYRLHLMPDPARPRPALILVLECDGAPPAEHAPSGVLGPLDKFHAFEILAPQRGDRDQRHVLLAHFDPDATTPRRTKLVATWTDGELESLKTQAPLQELHTQLSWALHTTKKDWWPAYERKQLASDVVASDTS
jgi:hypothetical protein